MGSYPTAPRAAFVNWCKGHTEVFTDNAAGIGLTAPQALAFKNATNNTLAALDAQQLARQALDAANEQVDNTLGILRTSAGDTVRTIRAFAQNSADPSAVYQLAQIPSPATPTPVPPPAQPTALRFELAATTGELTLRWKCSNPPGGAGTSYIVRRKLAGESGFSFLGVSNGKKFIDTTLEAGPDWVQYCVQGQRSSQSGPVSDALTINFGRAPGGGMTVTSSGMSQVEPAQSAQMIQDAPRDGSAADGGPGHSTVNGRRVQKVLAPGRARPHARM